MPNWKKVITSGSDATLNSLNLTSTGSGQTVLDIQGSQGQLFSITDDLTGDIFSISDISGVPIFNINASGATTFDGYVPDNSKLKFGNSGDLEIYHDGSHSRIKDAGTGNLVINASSFVLNNSADSKNMIIATDGGATSLYCNGSLKLATTSTGVAVTGNAAFTGDVQLLTSTGEYSLYGTANGQTALYNNGVKKFETNTTGVTVTGNATLSGFVLDGNTITGIDDSGEFTDNDAHIMTSAGVNDRITSFGYTTNTGTLTGNGTSTYIPFYNGTTSFGNTNKLTWDGTYLLTNSLKIAGPAAQNSEATSLMINSSGIVGTRELGSGAFASAYSLPLGTSSARGGFKIGYSENGKNYPVELSSEKMYVNVPWTDTNTQATRGSLNLDTDDSPTFAGLTLGGVANPQLNFNGSSDDGVDMAIKATPEALQFLEPEDGNKVHFEIKDDTGVSATYGYQVNGTTVLTSGRALQNVSGNISMFTNDSGYKTTDNNTVTSIRRDNTGTYRTGNINLVGGTNVTISEGSAGVFTITSTDTNTNTTYSAGTGLTLTGTTFKHSDTSSQSSVNGSGRTYIQDITLDTFGHVTGLATATETVVNTDTQLTATEVRESFSAGSNVSITEDGVISATDTNTNTVDMGDGFIIEDGDGTEVRITENKEVKFVEGNGIDINWTDTSNGSDGDPFDLTITNTKPMTGDTFDNDGTFASLRAGATTKGDVGLGNVTNESKATMFSSAALTGNPTAPTQTAGNDSTRIATTAFVGTAIDNLIGGAPGTLDTLDEIAAALNDDAALNTTLTNSIATKLPKSGGTMSGAINMNNSNITGVNNLAFADPGPNEGLSWGGGNMKLYESPNDLTTNTAGNLQIVYGTTRRLTVDNTGINVNGNATLSGFVLDGNTITGVDDSGEFTNNDSHIMTSAAVEDKILSYGYSTTDTNTNKLTTFQVEDGDGTEVTISNGKEWKFTEGTGIDINWTDTSNGSDADPYDLQFALKTAGVGSGTYGSTANGTKIDTITVDAYGRVTAVATGTTAATDTIRPIRTTNGDTNTNLESNETLNLKAGTNVSISETAGIVTFSSTDTQLSTSQVRGKVSAGTGISYNSSTGVITCDVVNTDTNTNKLTTFQVEDGDGTEVTISHAKEWKFTEGQGINVNWTDVSPGSDSDPYDLNFALKANGVRANELNVSGNGTSGQVLTSDGDGSFSWTSKTTNTNRSDASVYALFSAGSNVSISDEGVISATDTNTDTNTVTSIRRDNTGTYRTGNINLVGGSNVTITETSAGVFSFASTDTNTDTNTTYLLKATQVEGSNSDPYIKLDANSGTDDLIQLRGGGATSVTRDNDGQITISSTDNNTQLSTSQVRGKISGTGLISYNSSTGVISTTANNYSLPAADATTRGGIELFSSTPQSVAANTVSTTSNRTYGLQVNSAGQGVVNVPWTDSNTITRIKINSTALSSGDFYFVDGINTSFKSQGTNSYSIESNDTTYSAGGDYGITLSGTQFRLEDDRRRNSSTTDIKTGNTHDYTWYDADVGIRWYVAGAEDMRLQNGGTLQVDGDVVAYSTTISDERLKDNVTTIENPLDKIKKLRGVEYDWNAGSRKGKRDLGLIAQEVEKVIPNIVHEHEQPFLNDDEDDKTLYKTVDYEKMVAVLIEGMKDQQSQIDELKSEINQLKGKA